MKDWINVIIFDKNPYQITGFEEGKEYKWVKPDYDTDYFDLYIHRTAISRFLLPHINGLEKTVEIESNINRIIVDILSGHLQINNLEMGYSISENDYQMDALFLHLKFEFQGKTLYLNAYGWGVDLHLQDIGYGKHAIAKRFKAYSWGEERYVKYAPATIETVKEVIEKQKREIVANYGNDEPDKEMIEANRESLEKRALGESLGLSYNYGLDDFE